MSSLRLSSAASFFCTKPHYSSSSSCPPRPSSSSSLRHPPPHSLSLIRGNPDWRTLASSAQPHPLLSVVSPNKNHNNPLFINTTPNYNKYYKSNFTKNFLGFLLPYFSPRNSARSSPPSSLPSPSRDSTTRSGSGSSHPTSPSSGSGSVMGSENNKGDDWYPNDRGHLKSPTQPPSSSSSSPSMPNHQHHHKKLLTLPTILTLGRVAAVPLLIATFYVDSSLGRTATTGIFIVAAITDWLDGYLARKMRLGTAFGAFLDPVADKLMVAATLILLCSRPFEVGMFGQVPWLLTVPSIAIIGREITMSAVREWAASQNSKLLEAVAVNNLGKWKTAAQMTALTILLATRDSSLGGPGILVASGVALLYISAGLSVWSLAVYMRKIWKVLLK